MGKYAGRMEYGLYDMVAGMEVAVAVYLVTGNGYFSLFVGGVLIVLCVVEGVGVMYRKSYEKVYLPACGEGLVRFYDFYFWYRETGRL